MSELQVKVPPAGTGVESVLILEWLASPGDRVAEGAPLVVVETDKATMEIEAPVAGVLAEITAGEDQEVGVGHVICVLRS